MGERLHRMEQVELSTSPGSPAQGDPTGPADASPLRGHSNYSDPSDTLNALSLEGRSRSLLEEPTDVLRLRDPSAGAYSLDRSRKQIVPSNGGVSESGVYSVSREEWESINNSLAMLQLQARKRDIPTPTPLYSVQPRGVRHNRNWHGKRQSNYQNDTFIRASRN